MQKSSTIEFATDSDAETELEYLVGFVERHSPRLVQLRQRVGYILEHLEGPQPEDKGAAVQDEACGLIHRLGCANSKTLEALEALDWALARLEKLV